MRLARESTAFSAWWSACASLAELAAAHGAVDECRDYQTDATEAVRGWGTVAELGVLGHGASGLLALGLGRYEQAVGVYAREVLPLAGPLKLYPAVADAIEALARAGHGVEAALLDEFTEQAVVADWPWALASAAHLRAIVSSSAAADSEFEQALHWHEEARQPFPKARTQLAYGEWLRRAGRRIDARVQLRGALETFAQLEAEPWAARAHSELRATGERARRRTGPALRELTPQELQVALVVARYATNKEVAAQLFLSPKTIEKHLGSVYAKLGVRSRTELAAVLTSARVAASVVSPA